MAGKIERVTSKFHKIKVTTNEDGNYADVTLDEVDKYLVPSHDFILLIRDISVSTPQGLTSINSNQE
jgi:hypothetical protein